MLKNHSSDGEFKIVIFISRPFPHHMNSIHMNETLSTRLCQILSSCPALHAQIVFLLLWKCSISWNRIFFSKRKCHSLADVQDYLVHSKA